MKHIFTPSKGIFFDSVFLTVIVILSLLLYVPYLGFYSDDWAFLGSFYHLPQDTIFSFFKEIFFPQDHSSEFQSALMRPIHLVYIGSLYSIFGLHPLGYHVINSIVLIGISIFFYLSLRYLHLPRLISLTLPLVYILLPNYSSDRFWIAAFQINLSMAFYFISLYAGLRAVYGQKNSIFWGISSVIALLLSTLSYEVVLPLFLLNTALYWKPLGEKFLKHLPKPSPASLPLVLCSVGILILVLVFKALITTRMGEGPFQGLEAYSAYIAYITFNASWINFITHGIKLPFTVLRITKEYFTVLSFVISLGGGLLIWFYLYFFIDREKISKPLWITLILIGSLIFFLGYAIFFINNNIGFSVYGIANRISIAASIGVSLILVGILGITSEFFTDFRKRHIFFTLLISLICAGNILIIQTIASFWILAYQQEKTILSDIRQAIPKVASHTTVILDGSCSYLGPAVVFESNWDLAGALKVHYNDSTLKADVVTDRLAAKSDGLYTKIYGQIAQYPYGDKTFIYNYEEKRVYPISTYELAQAYFNRHRTLCPKGREGHGISIL